MSTIQYIKDLAAKKVSSKTIASVLNLDIDYVVEVRKSILHNRTIPIGKLSDSQLKQLDDLFIKGKSSRYIAKTLNLNYDALNSYLDQKYPNQRTKKNLLDSNTKDIIYRMYEAGDSVERIAELTKRTTNSITRLLKQKGIYRYKNKKAGKQISSKQVETILNLHKQGLTTTEIAKQVNVNQSTVARWIKKKKAL